MTNPTKSLDLCIGCRKNKYNGHYYGVKQCFSYKKAIVVKALAVGLDDIPPYNKNNITDCLNCYEKRGMCFLKKFEVIKKGKYKGMCCQTNSIDYFENEAKQND